MAVHNNCMSGKEAFYENNSIWVEIIVFVLGGAAYGMMEVLFRGNTHWSMILTGGACVLTLFYMRSWLLSMPLVIGALIGALVITCYEFFVGVLVNIRFGWDVWDYSDQAGNILGQICPQFTCLWFAICLLFFGIIRIFSV